VQLGLLGFLPETVDTSRIVNHLTKIKNTAQLQVHNKSIPFLPATNIIFEDYALPHHPNTLKFIALLNEETISEATYYSIGGGFIEKEGEAAKVLEKKIELKYPIAKAADLIKHIKKFTKQCCNVFTMVVTKVVYCPEV